MGPCLLSVLLFRAVLIATPFAIWFVWREWARRNGRVMGATPWAWLSAAAAVLVGLSLLISPLLNRERQGGRYVPAETLEGGRVAPGHYEYSAKP